MNSIGGRLDYRLMSQMHRPADQLQLQREVWRMARTGLRARDISTALDIPLPEAIALLAEAQR